MPAQRGFTLLELLVVIAIAGLMTGLAVASLESGKAPLQQALERLAAAARAQAELAVHGGQVRGLRWNGQRPEFVQHIEGGEWRVDPVALGDWPAELRADWPASLTPRVIFTPSGLAAPARLNWRWADGAQRWQWQRDAGLQITALP